jgi:hypothetical protein
MSIQIAKAEIEEMLSATHPPQERPDNPHGAAEWGYHRGLKYALSVISNVIESGATSQEEYDEWLVHQCDQDEP